MSQDFPRFKPRQPNKSVLEPVFDGLPPQLEITLDTSRHELGYSQGIRQLAIPRFKVLRLYGGMYGHGVGPMGEMQAGGLETHIKLLTEKMAMMYPIDFHVGFTTYDRHDEERIEHHSDWPGSIHLHPIYRFGSKPIEHSLWTRRMIKQNDVDIVHMHNPHVLSDLGSALAVRSLGRGLAVTYHSEPNNVNFALEPKRDYLRTLEIFREYMAADGIRGMKDFFFECISKGVGKMIPNGGVSMAVYSLAHAMNRTSLASASLCSVSEVSGEEFGKRTHLVIGNPLDTDFFSPNAADQGNIKRLRDEHDLDGKKVIFYHARIEPNKGQLDLLKAFERVKAKYADDCKLVLVGTFQNKRYVQQIRDTARELRMEDQVLLLEPLPQDQIRDWIVASDVVGFTSHKEAFGRTGAEALSCETPLVAYNVGGIPSYCIPDITGKLVEKEDIRALGEALVKTLDEPEDSKKQARAGRQLIVDKFSDYRICDSYMRYVYGPLMLQVREGQKR